jgi:hypothetical protein
MIALIVACQVVALVGFARRYVERGRRIEALEDSICRERLARIAATLLAPSECREAVKVLASTIPQIWTPIEPRSSPKDSAASVTKWPPRGSWVSPVPVSEGRGAKTIHLKLHELIRDVKGERTGLMGLDQLSDDEVAKLRERAR